MIPTMTRKPRKTVTTKKKTVEKKSKIHRLLLNMKKVGGMTHEQMVKFLLAGTGIEYDQTTRKYFDSTLYGTRTRTGALENFCWRKKNGVWKVRGRAKIKAPFNPRRETTVEPTSRFGYYWF
jgi:hypothetical protein